MHMRKKLKKLAVKKQAFKDLRKAGLQNLKSLVLFVKSEEELSLT